jgi:hypothetical protein
MIERGSEAGIVEFSEPIPQRKRRLAVYKKECYELLPQSRAFHFALR